MLSPRVKLRRKRQLQDLPYAVKARKDLSLERVLPRIRHQGSINPVVR
jgi:hypothetical protein